MQLVVALPVKQIYSYQGVIYFMIGNSKKGDLQEKHSGDIYCYIPESGGIELVYAAGVVEGSEDHKLTVEESGIYFCYTIIEGMQRKGYFYHLPFGATEPVRDTKFMVDKGWKDYSFGISCLESRIPKEDGTRETIKLPISQDCFCVVGDILYFVDSTKISCINLNTMEQTSYDFLKAMQKTEKRKINTEGIRVINSFTIMEDAVWVTTGAFLYQINLQNGKVNGIKVYVDENIGNITILYTDGKELYGVNEMITTTRERVDKKVVRILTDSISDTETIVIEVEDLVK